MASYSQSTDHSHRTFDQSATFDKMGSERTLRSDPSNHSHSPRRAKAPAWGAFSIAKPSSPGRGFQSAATVVWRCSPSPSTRTTISSPGRRKRCGFMPMPTPDGVPVAMMSPGTSFMNCDM
ncbi:hypothetical protein SAMN04488078_1007134 [Antarctobacter heliothermus]|uniref:Uncharacterized protein n=1 Tax=Antarctobacter heliothermus TaxID=74033 RepID=A0A239CQV7_9RHOB|nr:hypothetical protein SAMN04488078_1007134 [Antarctobacter heliothermus]